MQVTLPGTCPVCDRPVAPYADSCAACASELDGWWRAHCLAYAHYNRALRLASGGRVPGALAAAAIAVALRPRQAALRVLLARLFAELGALDDALECLTAVDLGSDGGEAGALYVQLAQRKRAAAIAARVSSETLGGAGAPPDRDR